MELAGSVTEQKKYIAWTGLFEATIPISGL